MRAKLSLITLLFLLSASLSSIFLTSCEQLQEATTFKVPVNLPDSRYTIDQSSFLKSEMEMFSKSYPAMNIDSIAGSYAGYVKRVSFYKLKLSIVAPESAKLNFLTSARITVIPEGGLPVEIATSPTINANDRSIDFELKDVDILTVIKKRFTVTLFGNPNGTIPTLPMDVLMENGLEFTISPLK